MSHRKKEEAYVDPDSWLQRTPIQEGSWWPAWHEWLSGLSAGTEAPPEMGAPSRGYVAIMDAPGTYVLQR